MHASTQYGTEIAKRRETHKKAERSEDPVIEDAAISQTKRQKRKSLMRNMRENG